MQAFSVFLLLALATAISSSSEAGTFTNSWAVEVNGGREAADQLAVKYGFTNLGQV